MKKRSIIIFSAILSLILIVIGFIYFSNNNKYVVEINGEKVSAEEFKFMLELVKLEMQQTGITDFYNPIDGVIYIDVAKEKTLESISRYKLGVQEAKKQNIQLSDQEISEINKQSDYILEQTPFINESLKKSGLSLKEFKGINLDLSLANKIIQERITQVEVTDEQVKDHYSKNIQKFVYNQEMVRAKHILFKTHDRNEKNELVSLPKEVQEEALKKANEVLQKAKSGEDFAKLAKEYSEDEGSKHNGGEYIFARGDMLKEFEDTAFSLKPGEISDLVKTIYGYHIIKLEEKFNKGQSIDFELVKESVEIDLKDYTLVEQWKNNSKIVRNERIYDSIS